jgi:release factor glutamine methyltransferase
VNIRLTQKKGKRTFNKMGLAVKELLGIAENILQDSGDIDYKKDTQILFCHGIGYDESKLFMNWTRELDDRQTEVIFSLVRKRAEGVPTQYLTNEQEFLGHNFFVDECVLIPRTETETLAETVILHVKNVSAKSLLDLGTGSGIIAISLALHYPAMRITAADISDEAISVAKMNAKRLNAEKHIKFVKSDLFGALKTGRSSKYDIIVSNPPYIKSADLKKLQREIYEHEPLSALDGGQDGLCYYRRIIDEAPAHLSSIGALFLEIGNDQASAVTKMLSENGHFRDILVTRDLSGNDRVISAQFA